jgi:uncharacterized protein (TIGR03437 family)
MATLRRLVAVLLCLGPAHALGQVLDWHHLGNSLVDLSLAGLAGGPVNRVWYSADGSALFAATSSGRVFQTNDFDTWQALPDGAAPPPRAESAALPRRLPELGASVRNAIGQGSALFAFGQFVYRSQDAGLNWDNLTGYRTQSIIGSNPRDMAVSPRNPDELVVATAAGIFRSMDAGRSWSGLNQGLPNLPTARLRALPQGDRGVHLEFLQDGGPAVARVVEWAPGEKVAWRPSDSEAANVDNRLRAVYTQARGALVTAITPLYGATIYTGMVDGRISVSNDGGRSWQTFASNGGPVESFWVDAKDPRVALAVLGSKAQPPGTASPHVLRTENAGLFWDDLKLGDIAAHGVTASRASGAIYVATDRGVFYARTDLNGLGPTSAWQQLAGLPAGAVSDLRLDDGENQLWAVVEGFGVYSTLAPHRLNDPRVVSAADMVARAAAPGSLMSILGARVATANAGGLPVPVLAADENESQIQIPFDARGTSLSLAIESAAGQRTLPPLTLQPVAPAIFVDPHDGAPLLVDAVTRTMLDAMNPAHSRSRIQVLATGLGKVVPDWPAGLPAPLANPPRLAGTVRAMLDRVPVEVTSATLAPSYTGFYLIEIELPKIVNFGPAELHLELDGQVSNSVRVYIEP